ncbi:MAG: immune inhibitor A [Anaerolineae bacterium]|nr:immune inhibitor A [Anaerolineae bacterium]
MDNRRLSLTVGGVIAIVVVVAFVICSCCVVGVAAYLILGPSRGASTPQPTPFFWQEDPLDPGPETEAPGPMLLPPPDEALETLLALESAVIPNADLHDLGIRYRGVPADTPRVASTTDPDYPIGQIRVFKASNLDDEENFEVRAKLVYKTDHVYMWIEEGLSYDLQEVQDAADLFEEHTYPTNREFFGSEWTPGVDGDPHLSILHASNLGSTVAGYFSSADAYVRAVRADSNEAEMFYIHLDKGTELGDAFYNGVLAHEFQHMIHWNNDRNEATWLNEGCSELAMELNNRRYTGLGSVYDVGGSEYAYLDRPDTQLNNWPEVSQTGSAAPHYGASYLFMSYFLDRFGEDATKALVAHDANGLESVDLILRDELRLDLTHEDVFADWVVANLVDDTSLADGRYGYVEIDVSDPSVDIRYPRNTSYPLTRRSTVQQYGVDYIEVRGDQPLRLDFVGNTQVRLMNTDAHSGKYLWWSNREDESAARLTRIIDLSSAQSARLDFWSWYHIEDGWDYAYVAVGTAPGGALPSDLGDPSITWHILRDTGLGCVTSDPNNANLGCGLTGLSDGWERLTADLSDYAGQEVALRFEYITDAAVNQAGFAVDDVVIVADGAVIFEDDAEIDGRDWIAEGFVRHANVLPQKWLVQLVTYSDTDELTVSRLLDGDAAAGNWVVPLSGDVQTAVIAISALAPVTTETAVYEYTLSSEP